MNAKEWRSSRVRRAVLVQCATCKMSATGTTVDGRLVSANLPMVHGPRHRTHRDCGGLVVSFDTGGQGRR